MNYKNVLRKFRHVSLAILLVLPIFVVLFACGNNKNKMLGDGTAENPYLVITANHLVEIAFRVNNGDDLEGVHFVLNNNIDLNGAEWKPIGGYENGFSGNFDGRGYTVSNFKIETVSQSDKDQYVGFFGKNLGKIKNFGIENFSFDFTYTVMDYSRGFFVGGLVGYNSGIIDRAFAVGNMNVGYEAHFSGAKSADIGGLIGEDYGTVTHCFADVGLIADSKGAAMNVGGLIGESNRRVENSFSVGNVDIDTTLAGCAGGLIGYAFGGTKILNCFASGDISAKSWAIYEITIGGFAGIVNAQTDSIQNCYRFDGQKCSKNAESAADNIIGNLVTTEQITSSTFLKDTMNWSDADWIDYAVPIISNKLIT